MRKNSQTYQFLLLLLILIFSRGLLPLVLLLLLLIGLFWLLFLFVFCLLHSCGSMNCWLANETAGLAKADRFFFSVAIML